MIVIPCYDTGSTRGRWIPNQVRYDESITITNIRNFTTQNASVETLIEAIQNSVGDDGESLLMRKIESIGKPLKEWNISINYGIKTGFNEAFIIDTAKRDELVARDPKSAEIIKPILRGRDMQKYTYEFANKWMIITKYESNHYLQEKYPEIYNHLLQYELKLQARGQCTNKNGQGQHHWLELDNNPTDNYLMQFEKEKILWGEISDKPKFSYENGSFYTEATSFIMTGENLKYLLAFLNSKLSKWYFERISTTTGMGTNRWKKFKLELLPIAIADDETPFINLVDEILETKPKIKEYKALLEAAIKNDNFDREIKLKKEIEAMENRVVECEKEIDVLVYALYGLSEDEILIVENNFIG